MARILVISDTHLEGDCLGDPVKALAKGADLILHAGDFISLEAYQALADLGRLEAVWGNCDLPALRRVLPERRTVLAEGVRIGLVHQASHGAGMLGPQMLAREMEVDVLVFGHIHRPVVEKGERLLLCPGSPTLPRMSAPTVAILEIEAGSVNGRIIALGQPACDYLRYAGSLKDSSPSASAEKKPM